MWMRGYVIFGQWSTDMIRHQIECIDLSHLGSQWRVTGRDKCPKNASGLPLKVTEPNQWMEYETALKAASASSDLTLGVLLDHMQFKFVQEIISRIHK